MAYHYGHLVGNQVSETRIITLFSSWELVKSLLSKIDPSNPQHGRLMDAEADLFAAMMNEFPINRAEESAIIYALASNGIISIDAEDMQSIRRVIDGEVFPELVGNQSADSLGSGPIDCAFVR